MPGRLRISASSLTGNAGPPSTCSGAGGAGGTGGRPLGVGVLVGVLLGHGWRPFLLAAWGGSTGRQPKPRRRSGTADPPPSDSACCGGVQAGGRQYVAVATRPGLPRAGSTLGRTPTPRASRGRSARSDQAARTGVFPALEPTPRPRGSPAVRGRRAAGGALHGLDARAEKVGPALRRGARVLAHSLQNDHPTEPHVAGCPTRHSARCIAWSTFSRAFAHAAARCAASPTAAQGVARARPRPIL